MIWKHVWYWIYQLNGDIRGYKTNFIKSRIRWTRYNHKWSFPTKKMLCKKNHYCKETTVYFCLFGVLDHTYCGMVIPPFFLREFSWPTKEFQSTPDANVFACCDHFSCAKTEMNLWLVIKTQKGRKVFPECECFMRFTNHSSRFPTFWHLSGDSNIIVKSDQIPWNPMKLH